MNRAVDWWITGREKIVNVVVGSKSGVLNEGPTVAGRPAPFDPAGALRQLVGRLSGDFVDPTGSRVDYARLRASLLFAELQACARALQDFDLETLTTREKRLAFWINLYNALIVHAVIAFGVRHSVNTGTLGLLGFFRRTAYRIGGLRFSADDIEHGVLRANRGHPLLPGPHFRSDDPRRAHVIAPLDPRIHFALNCASRSCPPIAVYAPQRVDQQLDQAARAFVQENVEVTADGTVCLSALFRWYAGDFGGRAGVLAFIARYLPADDPRVRVLAQGADRLRLAYRPYDWRLNDSSL